MRTAQSKEQIEFDERATTALTVCNFLNSNPSYHFQLTDRSYYITDLNSPNWIRIEDEVAKLIYDSGAVLFLGDMVEANQDDERQVLVLAPRWIDKLESYFKKSRPK